MKIAIVTHIFAPNDGQGRVNLEVAKGAALAGHEVHLIAERVSPELLELPGISWTRVSHGPLPSNLLRYAWFGHASGRVLKRLEKWADITVANGAVTNRPVDVNAVHFVHNGWVASPYFDPGRGVRGLYRRLYSWINARLELRAFRRTRRVIAVSGQVAEELRAAGVPATKVEVIPNGVDAVAFDPARDAADLPIPKPRVRALFVGDIVSSRKGLDTAIEAIAGVDGVTLVVAGRTQGSPYPDMVNAAGLDDKVLFLGFRRDIADIMRACDLFVFPSRYEACSLVLLEASAAGLPVITGRTTGGAELLDEDSSLKLDNPEDAETLRRYLQELADDPARRARMAARSREIALELSWDKMAQRYVESFQQVWAQKQA